MSRRARIACVWGFAAAALIGTLALPPISQNPAYHQFADQRRIFGIPHFWDVVSNAGFLAGGLYALRRFPLLAASVIATAFGSACYHYDPTDATLFWDRLPIAVLVMTLLAMVIGDRIGERAGRLALAPLLAAGVASVLYWRWTGDVRFYGLVQFFPVAVLVLLVALFPSGSIPTRVLAGLGIWYGVARAAEVLDRNIWMWTRGWIGGHTLKHASAAVGIYWLVRRRRPKSAPLTLTFDQS